MPTKVFISYRRDDSSGHAAGRIHDRLLNEPDVELFMDVDAIPLGSNFLKVLSQEVAKCDVLLAIIGPGWLDAQDEDGRRRLAEANDWVRIEIAAALQRDIPVIPVLIGGTRIPKPDQLPADIRELSFRQGLEVRHPSFPADVDRLVRGLRFGRSPPVSPDIKRPANSIEVDVGTRGTSELRWLVPGNGNNEWFKDYEHGPELVVVPAGRFLMGSIPAEIDALERQFPDMDNHFTREGPAHEVTIPRPFAVGRHAVTRGQYAAFVSETGHKSDGGALIWTGSEWKHDHNASWNAPGFAQDDTHPVVCVSWDDAKAYVRWLDAKAGTKGYRLLSEAEREYVTRAGATTAYWWGDTISTDQANYDGNLVFNGATRGEFRKATVPVGSFKPNPWGLFQVHGNSYDWCEDEWRDNYNDPPPLGMPWVGGGEAVRTAWVGGGEAVKMWVLRGGSWDYHPQCLRSANRYGFYKSGRAAWSGLRVARTL